MTKLSTDFLKQCVTTLRRENIHTCSDWAKLYRVMGEPYPGKWTFRYHPWAKEMHDCDADLIVGQKSAQMGYTETALNKAFFFIDILKISVLYLLPSQKPDATDFSSDRFDAALDASAHLKNIFSDVSNTGHKRAGSVNLYIRGSRSRSQMKSVPAGLIVMDELDEFDQNNVELAEERKSGQLRQQIIKISTPTAEGHGINAVYKESSQEHWIFPCPYCGRNTELTFPECLVITAEHPQDESILDSHLVCRECGHHLPHETKPEWLGNGFWEPTAFGKLSRGFHVNQLYSMQTHPYQIAQKYLKSLTDVTAEQEFWNSKLGLPHVVKGGQITDEDIEACTKGYRQVDRFSEPQIVTMGIDVGTFFHYEITQWFAKDGTQFDDDTVAKVLAQGKVTRPEELDDLMRTYRVVFCVIDANPERRIASNFARRFPGHVRLCFYANGIRGRELRVPADDYALTVSVDRTSWMDKALQRFKNKSILVPYDLDEEYRSQIKVPARVYRKDQNDNPVARYISNEKDDHFAHARTYSEIALALTGISSVNEDIKEY
jgi:phage terminase large subunit GpA-like protein